MTDVMKWAGDHFYLADDSKNKAPDALFEV